MIMRIQYHHGLLSPLPTGERSTAKQSGEGGPSVTLTPYPLTPTVSPWERELAAPDPRPQFNNTGPH